jgi:hypothetical protein
LGLLSDGDVAGPAPASTVATATSMNSVVERENDNGLSVGFSTQITALQ